MPTICKGTFNPSLSTLCLCGCQDHFPRSVLPLFCCSVEWDEHSQPVLGGGGGWISAGMDRKRAGWCSSGKTTCLWRLGPTMRSFFPASKDSGIPRADLTAKFMADHNLAWLWITWGSWTWRALLLRSAHANVKPFPEMCISKADGSMTADEHQLSFV